MDPLSTSAGVIAILQLASDVVKYIVGAAGATKERRRLRDEILGCEVILFQLQDHADNMDRSKKWVEKIKTLERGTDTPLSRLGVTLDALRTKLKPKKGLKDTLSALKWPFNEKEVDKLVSAIQREKSLLQLALTNDCRTLIKEMKKSAEENRAFIVELIQAARDKSTRHEGQLLRLNTMLVRIQESQNYAETDVRQLREHHVGLEKQLFLDWITLIDYTPCQNDFINQRQAGSGQWFLDSGEFQAWVQTDKQTLFCPGIPGAGKTIITSIVIENLDAQLYNDQNVGLAYLYCSFLRQSEQRTEDLLQSLLKQLVQGRSSLPDSAGFLYEYYQKKRTRPSLNEISRALQSVAAMYSRVFIIIDALDECRTSDGRGSRLLSEIFTLQSRCGVNIFATSRFIPEIMEKFTGSISLEIRASKQDVRSYIDGHISRLPSFVGRDLDLQEEIKVRIIDAVDGMFLLAKLHLDSLIGKRSPKAIKTALTYLPTGSNAYDDAYEDAMKRIEGQMPDQTELAKQVLSWVTCAKRQLTTLELQHALATEVGELEFDQDNVPQLEDMVSVCAGLITVNESGVVQLVHYTAQDYFERTKSHWFPDVESNISAACVTYLSFTAFESGFCQTDHDFEKTLQSYPLYDYATHNWGHHARSGPAEIRQLILDFLQNETKVFRSSQVKMVVKNYHYPGYTQDVPREMTGVHLAACFELPETIEALLKNGNRPDSKDTYGRTPLSYAAEKGNSAVVAVLLARNDVDPNSKDSANGWTPLWYAVVEKQLAVVKMLLENRVVDPDSRSRYGCTPLSWAATNGHGLIVKLLLNREGVDLNAKDFEYGRTPLSWAAERGHRAAVEALLAKDGVDLGAKSKYGRTPLWFSKERGHEAIVELLLKKIGVDHNFEECNSGQMSLSYAAERGQEAMAKLLLENGVDPDSKSKYGRTALSYAAERGHTTIVKLLLGNYKVNPDSKDSEYGRTPLSWAAANGHEAVVKLLLKESTVDSDSKSTYGRTPLSWAARCGRETVVKLLLSNNEIDPDSKFEDGRTPLMHAAEKGHETVVKLLLEKDGVSICSKDSVYGRTPLSWALMNGHEAIVKLLLKRVDGSKSTFVPK